MKLAFRRNFYKHPTGTSWLILSFKFADFNKLVEEIDQVSLSSAYACNASDCKGLMPTNLNSFSILTQNVRSIGCNFHGFSALLEQIDIKLDILVLTECWLSCCPNIPIIDNYDHYVTKNVSNQNEGVVVYVKNNLRPSVQEPLFNQGNCLVLKFNDVAIISIYRSPSFKNIDTFLISLNNVLDNLSSFKNIVIIGDINIDIAPDSLTSDSSSYLNLLASHGLLPTHTFVTRDQSKSCLDHSFLKTNAPAVTLVPQTTLTDHKAVLLFLTNEQKRFHPPKTQVNYNYSKISSDLELINLDYIYDCTDPNLSLNYLIKCVQSVIINNTKVKNIPCRKKTIKPWVTPGLLRCIRNRDRLHSKANKSPSDLVAQAIYRRYRNFCNSLLKRIRIQYEKSLLDKAGNNNKKIWNVIKSVTSTVNQKTVVMNCSRWLPLPTKLWIK